MGSVNYSLFREKWKEWGISLSLLGFTPARDYPDQDPAFSQWVAQGRGGTMGWLERHAPLKFHPQLLLPGAQTLLFTALNYYQEVSPEDRNPARGRFARYAWGRDYHKTIGGRLKKIARALEETFPGEKALSFSDSGPLAERWYAQQSGLGFVGRHTLLIDPEKGSWFLLGGILTTLEVTEEVSLRLFPKLGHCPSSCRRCLTACPTGALEGEGLMDARKCLSYLTIEHKGSFPVEYREALGNLVFGCDICQEVCPFNLRADKTEEPEFLSARAGSSRELKDLLTLSEEAFQAQFSGTPVYRTGLRFLIRNACVAAGNSGDPSLLEPLGTLAQGGDELLAEHARWAMLKLGGEVP